MSENILYPEKDQKLRLLTIIYFQLFCLSRNKIKITINIKFCGKYNAETRSADR